MTAQKSISNAASQPWLREVIKFGIVGTIGAVVDLGLLNIFHLKFGWSIYLATFWAFAVAVVMNYLLNNYWTYSRLGLAFQANKLMKFAAISTVGLGVTELIIDLLSVRSGLNYNLAKIIAIGLVFFWNFFANRAWTFRAEN